MKIDIFSHIELPQYTEAVAKVNSATSRMPNDPRVMQSSIFNLEKRFEIMDMFEDMVQVLTMHQPGIEQIANPEKSPDLAKIANDEIAELVDKYPDRFVAGVASLPMNNIDAALKEVDRAINDLKLKGVQVYSNINGKPLDSPEFLPLYEKMAQYDLPIWIHPARGVEFADYKAENRSRYGITGMFNWPHETTVAIARLSLSGVMAKYPGLKFITHHCAGTIPYMASRVVEFQDSKQQMHHEESEHGHLTRKLVEYLKMFYADTANFGGVSSLMCCFDFFGAEHMLFGTDMPLCVSEPGISGVRLAIKGIEQMSISDSERQKIYADNAMRLLRLS